MKIAHIYKRDQSKQPFKLDKITSAILQAMISVGKDDEEEAILLAASVHSELLNRKNKLKNYLPNIEFFLNQSLYQFLFLFYTSPR